MANIGDLFGGLTGKGAGQQKSLESQVKALEKVMKDLATAAALAADKSDRSKLLNQLDAEKKKREQLLESHKKAVEQTKAEASALDKVKASFATMATLARNAGMAVAGAVVGLGGLASPAMFHQFTLAMRDLGAVVGQMLLPVFDTFIKAVRGLADWVINLPSGVKALVGALAFLAVGLVAGVFAVNALTAAFAALDVASGGILLVVGLVVTALAGLAYWFTQTESGGKAMKSLWEALKPVWKSVEMLVGAVSDSFGELFSALSDLAPLIGTLVAPAISLLISMLKGLIDSMTFAVVAATTLAPALANPFKLLASDKMWDEIERRYAKLKNKSRELVSSVGAAPGKASFMALEQLGKNVQISALEMGAAKQNAEAEKKKQAAEDEAEKKERDKAAANAAKLSAERLLKLAEFALGPLQGFVDEAKRRWL